MPTLFYQENIMIINICAFNNVAPIYEAKIDRMEGRNTQFYYNWRFEYSTFNNE